MRIATILVALCGVSYWCAAPVASSMSTADDPAAWREVISNDGSWRVEWRLLMDGKPVALPLPRKRFTIELRIKSTQNPEADVQSVIVDAQMPDHRHGMNVASTISLEREGLAKSEGMLFHMTGRWEVDVEIDDGFTVERAQWDIGMY